MNGNETYDTRYYATRQKILSEAYQIIQSQGIPQLSMRSIAAAVKSSPANLYEYFANKDEIIYELQTMLLDELAAHLRTVDTLLPSRDYLEQIGAAYLTFAHQHVALLHLPVEATTELDVHHRTHRMYNAAAAAPAVDRTTSVFEVLYDAIKHHHAAMPAAYKSAQVTTHERAITFWAFLHGAATLHSLTDRPDYALAAWPALFRVYMHETEATACRSVIPANIDLM